MKRIRITDVNGVRLRERPQMKWIYTVKGTLNEMGMSVEKGRLAVSDRNNWRAVMST